MRAAPVPAALVAAAMAPAALADAPRWDWQLTEPYALGRKVEVMDIDPDDHSADEVAALKRRGVFVIAYVSVGSLEKVRADARAFPPEVVGNTLPNYPDERYLDLRRRDILLPLMKARFERAKAKGFDAIEADNMDVYEADSGFPVGRYHTIDYLRALADMAHSLGLQIGQKNVPELTGALRGSFDFAVTESCFQDGWCEEVLPYLRAGKPVFDAEYDDRPIDWTAACAAATRMGLSMIRTDPEITGGRSRSCQ